MKYTQNQIEELASSVLAGGRLLHGLAVKVVDQQVASPQWVRIEITFPDGTIIRSISGALIDSIKLGIAKRGGEVISSRGRHS